MSTTRLFKIPLLQILIALSLASGFLLIPSTTTAQLGVQILSTSPYTCTNGYNPVTDLQRLAGTTLISGLKVPAGATYACALFGGGGYQFFDDNAKFLGQGVGGFGKDTGNMDESGKIIPTVATCSGITGFFATPATCIGRTLSVVIGAAVISATAWLLAAAGLLFNTLVDHTIITFGYLFTAKVGEAIGIAWSAFRDIANIVIIGMFVFIAINMILGVKEFGEKKKVARVLIIAVLLNFSLLFTKIIIDASNFTAMQFYKASQLSTEGEGSDQLFNVTAFSKKGISGEFIRLMGLDSLKETSKALSAAAFGDKANQYRTANGWMALLHGLVSATLLLAAALVLLYGCFLIASRAVLLILLMVTSALAFASWLIPHNYIEEGWDKWWRSLLKAAFFAPILMALLWMALLVARAIKPEKGALGNLVADPTGTLDLNALFSYVIIIGLLFVVFKVAGEFSQSISGFNLAQGLVGLAALTPLAGASRVMGLVGRSTVGAGAGYVARKLYDKGYTSTALGRLAWRPFIKTAEKTFDPMNIKTVRKAAEGVGGMTFGDEVGKGGFLGTKRRQAEDLDKLARAMTSGRSQQINAAGGAESDAVTRERNALARQLATAQNAHQNAQQQVPQARTDAERDEHAAQERQRGPRVDLERARATATAERTNLEQQRDARRAEFQQDMAAEQQRIANAANGSQEQERARQEHEGLERTMDIEMQRFEQNLATANQQFGTHNQALQDWDTAVTTAADRAEETALAPTRQEVRELTDTINHLERERSSRVEDAQNRRGQELATPEVLSEAMARNKWLTVGRGEILRQLGGARERHGIRQIVSQIGQTGRAPQAAPPAAAPAAPTEGGGHG